MLYTVDIVCLILRALGNVLYEYFEYMCIYIYISRFTHVRTCAQLKTPEFACKRAWSGHTPGSALA